MLPRGGACNILSAVFGARIFILRMQYTGAHNTLPPTQTAFELLPWPTLLLIGRVSAGQLVTGICRHMLEA